MLTESTPKLSIITVSFNAEKTVKNTIASVANQTYGNIEHIIIDGKSTDKTIEIVNAFRSNITKVVSESDCGIYNAMNKGVALSSGKFLMFLNADDYLISDTVIENMLHQIKHNKADIYYGNLISYGHDTGSAIMWSPPKVSGKFLYNSTLPHPSTIYDRSIFDELGYFDETYKIAADFEFYLRAFVKGSKFKKIEILTTVFSTKGISSDGSQKKLITRERTRSIKANFSPLQQSYLRFRVRIKKLFNI